jgi:hypothetical protein
MIANLLGTGDVPAETVDLSPQCGQDFCDSCGDCLDCFREDGCAGVEGRQHAWVVYPDQVVEFKARRGLGGVS